MPFPAYRHRPGKTPHPVTDPAGHSFGLPHAEPVHPGSPRGDAWRACELYLVGVDLFNHGYWWEAHEAWETLWRAFEVPREEPQARVLRALIQIAAARLRADAGDNAGAGRVLARARENLSAATAGTSANARPERLMGLDLQQIAGALAAGEIPAEIAPL